MKKKTQLQGSVYKTNNYFLTPAITTIAFPMLIGRKKQPELPTETAPKPTPKPKGLTVTKYEIADSVLKFFDAKGFLKKRWVIIKEIPVYKITSIESFGNEVTIDWNDSVFSFVSKKKNESFTELRDQIRDLLERQQQTLSATSKDSLKKIELSPIINSSISIVDSSFNILMGLQPKIVNWTHLEGYTDILGSNLDFKGLSLEKLNLDFGFVSAAVKKQAPQETAKESFEILKKIYGYFDDLNLDNDVNGGSSIVKNVKEVIFAYYILNDLMLGKVIGVADSEKEVSALEGVLLELANKSNLKLSFGQLKVCLNQIVSEGYNDGVIEDARLIFKDQLKLL